MPEVNETFARNLSQMLKRRGMTQMELAEKVGVSNPTITYWLTGKKTPRMNKLQKLAEVLDISMHTLIDENGYEDFDNQIPHGLMFASMLPKHKIKLLGSMAAGEPILDEEFPEVFMESPTDADFALKIKGDSMEPTYKDGDIVFIKECPDLPHDNAVVVIAIDNEASIKHVSKTNGGIVVNSDNPDYPPKVYFANEHELRIVGLPVGYLRMFKRK